MDGAGWAAVEPQGKNRTAKFSTAQRRQKLIELKLRSFFRCLKRFFRDPTRVKEFHVKEFTVKSIYEKS